MSWDGIVFFCGLLFLAAAAGWLYGYVEGREDESARVFGEGRALTDTDRHGLTRTDLSDPSDRSDSPRTEGAA